MNEQDENIGARRLFTILEKVLEEISFKAEDYTAEPVVVDAGVRQLAPRGPGPQRRRPGTSL